MLEEHAGSFSAAASEAGIANQAVALNCAMTLKRVETDGSAMR